MNINPTQPEPPPKAGTGRLRRPPPEPILRPPEQRPAGPAKSKKDVVEISAAALEMNEALGSDEVGAAGLSPDRQKEILSRITQGFYRRPEVRDEIIRRLEWDIEYRKINE